MACEAPCDFGDVMVLEILFRPVRSAVVSLGVALYRAGVVVNDLLQQDQ